MSKSIFAPILSSEYLRQGFSSSSPSKVMLPTYLFSGEFSGASITMSFPFSRWIVACLNRSGTYGIEPQRREGVPCRSLSVVLVSAVTVGLGRVEAIHHLAHPPLGLVGLSAVVIEVDHVLCRLVSVGVVAHVGHLHLGDFVVADP